MTPYTINDLTHYHRAKVMRLAGDYWKRNHLTVCEITRGYHGGLPTPPVGTTIFYPEKWDATNWVWFTHELKKEALDRVNRGT